MQVDGPAARRRDGAALPRGVRPGVAGEMGRGGGGAGKWDVAAPPPVDDDPAVKLQSGEGDRNAGRGVERISNCSVSVGGGRRGGSWGNATTVGWALGREEYSETTVRGQDGGGVGRRKFRRRMGYSLIPLGRRY